ncbi:hypothetical protein J6590_037573 [Homalodisca vitripennis]|nr:hypothetical protein J6590_037573 [Homalodisca vitripennis]
MLDLLDKKEKEQNRASLKCIMDTDTTIFCGENEIPLQGHWATDGRKPFRKGGQFSSVARVQIKLTAGKTLLVRSYFGLSITGSIYDCRRIVAELVLECLHKAERDTINIRPLCLSDAIDQSNPS